MNQNTSLDSTAGIVRANPYVGSRPFKDGEAIFGRDREVRELLNRLYSHRIVLLYSPSGAGKTSLIQAGLMPQLRQEGFKVLPVVRVSLEPPWEAANRYIYSTFESLDCDFSAGQEAPATRSSLAACLGERLDAEGAEVNYMLIFDQFEEILTTAPTDRAGKQAYFEHLGEALNDKRIWALFAIREEFLGALDPYTRFIPTQFKHSFRLDLLSRPAALQAIQKPVEGLGIEFTPLAADQLVEDLSKVQVQQDGKVIEQSGTTVEPVLLQVVCTRLFNQLELENNPEKRFIDENDVANLGKVNQALGDYYTDELTKAASKWGIKERRIRDWFQTQLITADNHRSQVRMGESESAGLENTVIDELVDAHLVRAEARRNMTWYELAHDRLILPVRESNRIWESNNLAAWQRLAAEWANNELDSLLLLGEDLKRAEADFIGRENEYSKSERRFIEASQELRRQRQRSTLLRRVAAAGLILVILTGMLLVLYYSSRNLSGRLASQSRNLLLADHTAIVQSLLLSKEAFDHAETDLARMALYAGWSAEPRFQAALPPATDSKTDYPNIPVEALGEASPVNGEAARLVVANHLEANKNAPEADPQIQEILQWWSYQDDRWTAGDTAKISVNPGSLQALSPDGLTLAASGCSGAEAATVCQTQVWDTLTGQISWSNNENIILDTAGSASNPITSLVFSPNGEALALSRCGALDENGDCSEAVIDILRADNGQVIQTLKGYSRQISALAINADGSLLASGNLGTSADGIQSTGEIRMWDLTGGQEAATPFSTQSDDITSLAFDPGGTRLASGSLDSTIQLWDISDPSNPQPFDLLSGHETGIKKIVFGPAISEDSPSDSSFGWLASIDSNGNTICVWDLDSQPLACEALAALQGSPNISAAQDQSVTRLAVLDQGERGRIAAGQADGQVVIWDPFIQTPYRELYHAGQAQPGISASILAASPDLRWLAGAGLDPSLNDGSPVVALWNNQGEQEARMRLDPLQPQGDTAVNLEQLEISPDGKWLALRFSDGNMRIFNPHAQEQPGFERLAADNPGDVLGLTFSPDGRWLALGVCQQSTEDGSCILPVIELWDLEQPQPVPQLLISNEEVPGAWIADLNQMEFSPDGRWLAHSVDQYESESAAKPGVGLWDLSQQKPTLEILNSAEPIEDILSLAISPNSQKLAVGGPAGQLVLWNMGAESVLPEPEVIPENLAAEDITHLAFDPSSRFLLAAGQNQVALCDLGLKNGQPEGNTGKASRCELLEQLNPLFSSARPETGGISSLAFHPDQGKLIAVGSSNGVLLWEKGSTWPIGSPLAASGEAIDQTSFDQNGDLLVLASASEGKKLYRFATDPRSWYDQIEARSSRKLTEEELKFHKLNSPLVRFLSLVNELEEQARQLFK